MNIKEEEGTVHKDEKKTLNDKCEETELKLVELKKKATEEKLKIKEDPFKVPLPFKAAPGTELPKAFGKIISAAPSLNSNFVKKEENEEEDTFKYPSNTVDEFERNLLKHIHPTMWVNDQARRRSW